MERTKEQETLGTQIHLIRENISLQYSSTLSQLHSFSLLVLPVSFLGVSPFQNTAERCQCIMKFPDFKETPYH